MIIKIDRIAFKSRLWHRAYQRALLQPEGNKSATEQAKQLILYGIKCYGKWDEKKESDPEERMEDFFEVIRLIKFFTPREFMQIFPIGKSYDGNKWQMKDYFYTRDYLKMFGLDTPIGERAFEFLMEYYNEEVLLFIVNAMSALSNVYKAENGYGILEGFYIEKGENPFCGSD